MSKSPKKVRSRDCDRWIEDWTYIFKVPKRVSRQAYNHCLACKQQLTINRGDRPARHCRLCGEMYCKECTCKLYIPVQYETNPKMMRSSLESSLSTVCFSCKERCLLERQRRVGDYFDIRDCGIFETLQDGIVHLHPPIVFAPITKNKTCCVCGGRAGRRTRCCLVCGDITCRRCYVPEQDLPPAFVEPHNLNNETPLICLGCRFKINKGSEVDGSIPDDGLPVVGLRGIIMEEKFEIGALIPFDDLSDEAPTPLSTPGSRGSRRMKFSTVGSRGKKRKALNDLFSQGADDGDDSAENENSDHSTIEYMKSHRDRSLDFSILDPNDIDDDLKVDNTPKYAVSDEDGSDADEKEEMSICVIKVKWSSKVANDPIVEIYYSEGDSLRDIYDRLVNQVIALVYEDFHVTYKGVPVYDMLFDLIPATRLGDLLIIKKGSLMDGVTQF